MVMELDWLEKKANNVLIEPDWPSVVHRVKIELDYSSCPSMILHPHSWILGIAVFIDWNAYVNNSRGRKWKSF
jgi:hypothetical protein